MRAKRRRLKTGRLLQAVGADLPHGLKSIQLEGASEFMADFGQAGQGLGVPLFLLSPRRLQHIESPTQRGHANVLWVGALLMVRNFAITFLAAAAVAMAFFAGRASAPEPTPTQPTPTLAGVANESMPGSGRFDTSMRQDARAKLLRALELPTEERKRAIHQAVNAWLAQDGAAAIRAARDDPRLAEVVDLMTRIALVVHPDVFVEDPSLLQGVAEVNRLIAAGAEPIAAQVLDQERRGLFDLRLGAAMGVGARPFSGEGQPLSLEDAYAEVESILAEQSPMKRLPRLQMLVHQMAENDPAAAATLVDSLPASSKRHAINALITPWGRSDPSAAAHWLGNQGDQAPKQGFTQLAQQWGMGDFHSAGAFADTLSGAQRRAFLEGLAVATHSMPNSEKLAWIAKLEGDPNYPSLAVMVGQAIAQEDMAAAVSLIESLPQKERLNGFASVLPMMVMQDPEATMATIEAIGDRSQRDQLVAMIAPVWAQADPDRAMGQVLDLAPGPTRNQALASIAFGLAQVDSQRAIEAIDQIDDPRFRRAPVHGLLGFLEDENEAIRLGREHGFDREAVLEVRANSPLSLSGGITMPFALGPGGAIVGVGPRSFTSSFATPSMVMMNDGRGKLSAADDQPDEDH